MGLISTCVHLLILFLSWLMAMKWLIDTSPLPLALKLSLIAMNVFIVSLIFWITADRTRIQRVKDVLEFALTLVIDLAIYRLFYWGASKIFGYIFS